MRLIIDALKMQNVEFDLEQDQEYLDIVKDILVNDNFKSMSGYFHHGSITCLEHSVHVSYICYKVAKKLNLDFVSSARGGLLHDFFLYDWHTRYKEVGDRFHGLTHPKIALTNVLKEFSLNEVEKNIILRHMWPLTPVPPKYKESFVIVMVDKYCGTLETLHMHRYIIRRKKPEKSV